MGEKIRKLTSWVWNVKERLILAIMVAVLCQRVYDVMNPKGLGEADPIPHMPFRDESNVDIPKNPPQIPQDLLPESWTLLHKRPPTLFVQPRRPTDPTNPGGPDTSNLELRDIKKSGDGYRVQIFTGQGRPRWYEEGDRFESYEIVFIDPDEETVQVYSEETNRPLTLERN